MDLVSLGVRYMWTGVLMAAVSVSVEIIPPKVVVKYKDPISAVCTTNSTHYGMGWEAPQNAVDMETGVQSLKWTVDSVTEWSIKPFCYLHLSASSMERKELEVIVYQVPDTVLISLSNSLGSVVEGNKYVLQCKVKNSAPVRNLVVTWFNGQTELKRQNFSDTELTPKDMMTTHEMTANRSDNSAQFRCEAKLELGPEGPQPPPKVTSVPLRMNILYGPKFSKTVETLNQTGSQIVLNCTVAGNPPPSYSWDPPIKGEVQNISIVRLPSETVGNQTCTALNAYGSTQKLFIIKPKSSNYVTFWAIIGSGLVLAAMLIVGYLVLKKMSSNSVI